MYTLNDIILYQTDLVQVPDHTVQAVVDNTVQALAQVLVVDNIVQVLAHLLDKVLVQVLVLVVGSIVQCFVQVLN